MNKSITSLVILLLIHIGSTAQSSFPYTVSLEPVSIPNLDGLHSYAFAQHDGKWLIIGGRKDGLHARQPFNAFPASQNNDQVMVIDMATNHIYTHTLDGLSTPIQEQLQSTNMNFYQLEDTLMIIGGYGYAASVGDHITFPYATTIIVSQVIDAVIANNSVAPHIQQLTDQKYAVTGGQLGYIDGNYYLVGGHRFDGRYNPMNNPTFTQTYTHAVRKFSFQHSPLAQTGYGEIINEVHLRRRDYNLLPQIFQDGTFGYTISSGVFQNGVDLPFLYPVHITADSIRAETSFNQYLSNYHSAKAALWSQDANEMHYLFFGGMSQYDIIDGTLVADPLVPFVNTVSLLTRKSDGSLDEYKLPITMPGLKGAGAEFIPNHSLPHLPSEIIKLDDIAEDEFVIGHIYGGIYSPSKNPFSVNQTNTTQADPILLAVKLKRATSTAIPVRVNMHQYEISLMPNPVTDYIHFTINTDRYQEVKYNITNTKGSIVKQAQLQKNEEYRIPLGAEYPSGIYFITVTIDDRYSMQSRVVKR